MVGRVGIEVGVSGVKNGHAPVVTFGLNVRLNLSGQATTKSLSALCAKSVLKILGESTWTVAVRVICGDEGVGVIPGVRGGSGES